MLDQEQLDNLFVDSALAEKLADARAHIQESLTSLRELEESLQADLAQLVSEY
ncbi:MAG: hypothetical protein LBR58_04415 [Propionibacteriaceae bacterium]|jgi:hypothetical protein|nr:hypothetical protein [Propionibacteriaceae bacterium]